MNELNGKETSSDGDEVRSWSFWTRCSVSNRDFKKQKSRWVKKWKLADKRIPKLGWSLFQGNVEGVSRHFWVYFERITADVFVTRFQLYRSSSVSRLYTHKRIMCLDEVSCVVRRSRRISRDTSSRRIMRHAPVFILETHNLTRRTSKVYPSSSRRWMRLQCKNGHFSYVRALITRFARWSRVKFCALILRCRLLVSWTSAQVQFERYTSCGRASMIYSWNQL